MGHLFRYRMLANRVHGFNMCGRIRGRAPQVSAAFQETGMQTPVIGTHAHIVPAQMLKTLRGNSAHYGIEFSGSEKQTLVQLAGSHYIRPLPGFLTHVDERLATMDRQGIDMQILAGWVDFSAYTIPVDLGV